MKIIELNVDGLVGPTHHYAGLAYGNTASIQHAHQVANPREAALQGIKKMRVLFEKGLKQAFLMPQPRPNLALLYQLGFQGTPTQQIAKAFKVAPQLLSTCYSASYMWTANAATVSHPLDTNDGKVHFTPANLVSQLHRAQETAFTQKQLQDLFHDERYFSHHPPLPACLTLADEGAANHNRLAPNHDEQGVSIFVFGKSACSPALAPIQFPARQMLEASASIARNHGLLPQRCYFIQQTPQAIDAGVFHNDVISLSNESVWLMHQDAFVEQTAFLKNLKKELSFPLHLIEVSQHRLSLIDAVKTYLFNSQLLTLADGSMLLLAPEECKTNQQVYALIEEWIENPLLPIQSCEFINLKQSMQNGGGPACLRLRVPMSEAAYNSLNSSQVLTNTTQLEKLENWVKKYYRDRLSFDDLADPALIVETQTALEEWERNGSSMP